MTPFCAIDFETGDQQRDSACAIGLVRVHGAEIVYRDAVLIKPPRPISYICRQVHGITDHDVRNAEPFAQVWPKLVPVLKDVKTLVAHNAPFDRGVLEACCRKASLPIPACNWVCTLAMARERWKKPHSNKLSDVCGRLGIELTRHHHAGADAEAAARVLIAMEGRTAIERPPPIPDVKPSTAPQTAARAILEEIPAEYRTPAVLALMRDAEELGEVYARDLVRTVAAWSVRDEPGRSKCFCGAVAIMLCSLCPACIEKAQKPLE